MSEQEASPIAPLPASSAPLHWRVRVCRWLWRVLGFVWGTLIVGIVIGTIANLNATTTSTPLSALLIIHLVLTYPLLVWSSLGFLAVLTLLSWLGSREKQAVPARPLSEQDRVYMLRRLRLRYEQLFRQSLQGAVQLELGLAEKPAAVQQALGLALHVPDQLEHPLPPHTSIVQAYELSQQELLILGEPGVGKSTLLLEPAHSLVELAEQDATRPLPVLPPLSSWAASRRPLHERLGGEIAHLYNVPRRLSQQWVQAEQVLPLLDGLDEMEEAARGACIAAINTYHREHLRPLVVCSRSNEYAAAARHERLALHTAVVVQLLEPKQVDAYQANLGRLLTGLRAALKTNALLQELATTPLMLQVLMLTYNGTSVRALSQQETQLREQIWTGYVQHMVLSRGDARRYPLPVTIGWLRWLAYEMRQHNQTIFFLESLQSAWLPMMRRNQYRWSVMLVFGLLFVLFVGLGGVLGFGLFALLGFGLFALLVLWLVFWLAVGLEVRLDTAIKPVETFTWSWENFRSELVAGLVTGLVAGLVAGLGGGLVAGLPFGLRAGLGVGLLAGLGGLLVGLGVGLAAGFSGDQLTERLMLSPNEGIHRSLKIGLLLFTCSLVFWLLFWLGGRLLFGLLAGPGGGLVTTGLGFGLLFGLLFGLGGGLGGVGLDAAVRHYLLRSWLARSGVFPWRAVPFLEDATARILLRRVGGGYSFAHRLLLDFFADAYAGASSDSPAARSILSSPP